MTCENKNQSVGCFLNKATGVLVRASLIYDVDSDYFNGTITNEDGTPLETISDNDVFYAKYTKTQCPEINQPTTSKCECHAKTEQLLADLILAVKNQKLTPKKFVAVKGNATIPTGATDISIKSDILNDLLPAELTLNGVSTEWNGNGIFDLLKTSNPTSNDIEVAQTNLNLLITYLI